MKYRNVSAIVARNMKAYAEIKELMMRDIETGAGVAAGYLSRKANASDESGGIPLNVAVRIADILGQDLSDLMKENFMDKFELERITANIERMKKVLAEEEAKLEKLRGER